jgi:glycosyltransferase involved in cell wall biosynthesis
MAPGFKHKETITSIMERANYICNLFLTSFQMTPTPTISVLLAVYNTDFVLVKRAIDSVLNQDYQNFELVLIDDGSADEYSVHLLRYAKKHEDKVVFIRHKNCGQPKSIGRGLLNSTGSFVTILDADDE